MYKFIVMDLNTVRYSFSFVTEMGMLKNCCCCCSVKIGCIVLGVLGIIRSALTIGTLSAFFAQILTLISSVMESLHLLKDEENEETINMAGDAAQKVQGMTLSNVHSFHCLLRAGLAPDWA